MSALKKSSKAWVRRFVASARYSPSARLCPASWRKHEQQKTSSSFQDFPQKNFNPILEQRWLFLSDFSSIHNVRAVTLMPSSLRGGARDAIAGRNSRYYGSRQQHSA